MSPAHTAVTGDAPPPPLPSVVPADCSSFTSRSFKTRSISASSLPSSQDSSSSSPPVAASVVVASSNTPTSSSVSDVHRAVHRVNLSALRHNYGCVEGAANRQRCDVIVVVKADGYGHGAIDTALHLAEWCGASAFAVATLEEGIEMRKAFLATARPEARRAFLASAPLKPLPPAGQPVRTALGGNGGGSAKQPVVENGTAGIVGKLPASVSQSSSGGSTTTNGTRAPTKVSDLFGQPSQRSGSPSPPPSTASSAVPANPPFTVPPPKTLRPAQIRILVLGPPVGYPRCFDLYHHYSIEVMVSGPEVAKSLMEWVANDEERKRTEVERAAFETKEVVMRGEGELAGHHARNVRQSVKLVDDSDGENEDVSQQARVDSKGSGERGGERTPTKVTGGPPAKPPPPVQTQQHQSSTLSSVQGIGLAKEVRQILMGQAAVVAAGGGAGDDSVANSLGGGPVGGPPSAPATGEKGNVTGTGHAPGNRDGVTAATKVGSSADVAGGGCVPPEPKGSVPPGAVPAPVSKAAPAVAVEPTAPSGVPFRGLEDAAKTSRIRELAMAKIAAVKAGDGSVINEDEAEDTADALTAAVTPPNAIAPTQKKTAVVPRRKLRWHALVDSGMGRLGFKPPPASIAAAGISSDWKSDVPSTGGNGDHGKAYVANGTAGSSASEPFNGGDAVAIIKALYDAEVHDGAPIEFYGMCTHMADANSNSKYTNDQMDRFLGLLGQVRDAGILVPTVSTDNSSALLTTNLTHFDPGKILCQDYADTRGYVRTGGAIYGQRPAFPQLRAVSTLMASVRHVASVKEGDSVGYDRAYIAPHDVRIATLTIGFADGYPRELGNGTGKVSIRGTVFPIAGNVCMDMLMVDLGPADDREGPGSRVVVGDVAVLWGPEADGEEGDGLVKLVDVAATLKTTQSALTCGLDKKRVQRLLK